MHKLKVQRRRYNVLRGGWLYVRRVHGWCRGAPGNRRLQRRAWRVYGVLLDRDGDGIRFKTPFFKARLFSWSHPMYEVYIYIYTLQLFFCCERSI